MSVPTMAFPNALSAGGLSHLVEAATALAALNDGQSGTSSSVSCQGTTGARTTKTEVESKVSAAHLRPKNAKGGDRAAEDGSNGVKKETFPQRLLAILNDPTLTDVITWLPHGRSFVIVRPDVFTEKVLPKYLPPVDARSSTKYPSFTRKLNRWGFRQATRGPDTGSFHHPLFRKDMPHLCRDMVCQRSKDRPKGGKNNKTTPQPPLSSGAQHVGTLTKESLEAMATASATPYSDRPATVSVTTDDARSSTAGSSIESTSEAPSGRPSISMRKLPNGAVSTDTNLVASSLKQRDEVERLNVAQAMLYEAYKKALRESR